MCALLQLSWMAMMKDCMYIACKNQHQMYPRLSYKLFCNTFGHVAGDKMNVVMKKLHFLFYALYGHYHGLKNQIHGLLFFKILCALPPLPRIFKLPKFVVNFRIQLPYFFKLHAKIPFFRM